MGSYNKATIVGNLGRDAELRYTQSGRAVSSFNVATSETWNDKETGERKEKTEWHRIVLWGKTAETLQEYLKKGKQVLVEGRLQTRKWTDKDGNDRYSTEINGDRVVLLGSANGGGGRRRAKPEDAGASEVTEPVEEIETGANGLAPGLTDDDIPFAWLLPLVGAGLWLLSGVSLA